MTIASPAKTINSNESKHITSVFVELLENLLSQAVQNVSKNTKVQPNRGDMAEGVVGAAIVAAFLSPDKHIQPSNIIDVLDQLLAVNPKTSKRGQKAITREQVYANGNVSVLFGLSLARVNFDGLQDIGNNTRMAGYLSAAASYVNSKQIRRAVDKAHATFPSSHVSVLAGGLGRPLRSKCDVVVSHNGQVIPWGNVTLKCDTTKQLSMVSRNFDPGSFTSNSRGIRNLVEAVLGVDVGNTPNLHAKYDLAVKGTNKDDLLQVVEATYESAETLFNARLCDKGHQEVFKQVAFGIQKEALGDELDLIQIRLDEAGTYTYVDYQDLVRFSQSCNNVTLRAIYKPGNRETSEQPYLYIQATVDGINFGNLISFRPKIRHRDDGRIKEFKHYLQNEPGLESLVTYASKAS